MAASWFLSAALFLAAVPVVLAGNGHYTWEEDSQPAQNRIIEDHPLDDNKATNQKDFIDSLYERLFSKSRGDHTPHSQVRIRHARHTPMLYRAARHTLMLNRAARHAPMEFDVFQPELEMAKKSTTKRPTTKKTTKRPPTTTRHAPRSTRPTKPSYSSTTYSAYPVMVPNMPFVLLFSLVFGIFQYMFVRC